MKWLVLALALIAAQQPDRTTPREGPWAGKDGHHCWRHGEGERINGLTMHHCECQLLCDEHGNEKEDYSCATSCKRKTQCGCHYDESCEPSK